MVSEQETTIFTFTAAKTSNLSVIQKAICRQPQSAFSLCRLKFNNKHFMQLADEVALRQVFPRVPVDHDVINAPHSALVHCG
jgi:hypothetical protein